MSDLLNCPFCGNEAELQANSIRRQRGSWFVFSKCTYCGATGRSFVSDDDPDEVDWNNKACRNAAIAWNKREPIIFDYKSYETLRAMRLCALRYLTGATIEKPLAFTDEFVKRLNDFCDSFEAPKGYFERFKQEGEQ